MKKLFGLVLCSFVFFVSSVFASQPTEWQLVDDGLSHDMPTNLVEGTLTYHLWGTLVFDSVRNLSLYFGGRYFDENRVTHYSNKIWAWDGVQWFLFHDGSGVAPTPREYHCATFDKNRGVMVIAGGADNTHTNSDLWEFDGAQWLYRGELPLGELSETTMAYDSKRGVSVFFSGKNEGNSNEIWEWDGNSWTLAHDGSGLAPVARRRHQMVYDELREMMVLYGGTSLDFGRMKDTWGWNGAEWRLLDDGSFVQYRDNHTMVYDRGRGVTVLFGGHGYCGPCTFEWNGIEWICAHDGSEFLRPHPRNSARATYDENMGKVLMYSGMINCYGPPPPNFDRETWTYGGTNQAPVADAGPDQSFILLGAEVFLDGTNSYDLDGDELSYSWTMIKAPVGSTASIINMNLATPKLVPDLQGEYIIHLIVNDGMVDSLPDEVVISSENVKPVADAGSNQAVIAGDFVHLNGCNSFDANGDPLTYSWNIISAPVDSIAEINPTDVCLTGFNADLPGQYMISLVVNDGYLNSDPSTINVLAISWQDAFTELIYEAIDVINALDPEVFKNKNMVNALTNKLNATLDDFIHGRYQDALDKLNHDIIAKTDGCNSAGFPDKNDWIRDCESQGQAYPRIENAIILLRSLI